MAQAMGAFLKTLAVEPPIKPGTADPYQPRSMESQPQEHLEIGAITKYVTELVRAHHDAADYANLAAAT